MDISTIDNQLLGNTIRFRTYNPNDAATITGIVRGLVGADIARQISDIATYAVGVDRGLVSKNLPPLGDYSQHIFVIIEHTQGIKIAYSTEWFVDANYELVSATQSVNILLRNVSLSEVTEVMAAIQAMGISAKVVTN